MSGISWNEVRARALKFSREWADAQKEEPDKQTFWNEFFDCFGIKRKLIASFEYAVEKARGKYSFLDLFWKGKLLVEHKSAGASFEEAKSQAFAYMADLANDGMAEDVPRFVILCDFRRFALYDLAATDASERYSEFDLADLHKHVRKLAFMKGEKPVRLDPEDPANFKATQLLADLHDALAETGYTGHELERMLVRLLFCLFAEDTGIFDEPRCFTSFAEKTREDGADLGRSLAELFQVLNTPLDRRQKNLDEDLAAFPYVNGGLFAEALPIAAFTSEHRSALLRCCKFEWAYISPAVFGSLFQDILDDKERRQVGAHYTSERDIMKVIRSLFLDELREELEAAKADRSTGRAERLRGFKRKLRVFRLFDPACGCGNFLIIAYRELRRLEMEALIALHTKGGALQRTYDIRSLAEVDVDQFFGLEINEWPVRIAEVGLWLTDHQCNLEFAESFGESFRRLPLVASPTIRTANALRTDWRAFLPPGDDVLVLGNPPFVGKKARNPDQQADMELIFDKRPGSGVLDYVTCWYSKAAEYIQGTRVRCAFVSTNSIAQGEQVGVLFDEVFKRFGLKIHFAHRTFAWMSEARGKAHVHVVIVGFGAFERGSRRIYDYELDSSSPTVSVAANISPYLMAGGDFTLRNRESPLCPGPEMQFGSMPNDDGSLLFTDEERSSFLADEPQAAAFFRQILSAHEYLHGEVRWCLWLAEADPTLLRRCPKVLARIEAVGKYRASSKRAATRNLAKTPALFGEIRLPRGKYVLVPRHSSETRAYIPMSYFGNEFVPSDSCLFVENAALFHFGVLHSAMHMAWVRSVCGRLESRYRYSNKLVFNNYPWPGQVGEKERLAVESAAQGVLDARGLFPKSTLADIYDPRAMPAKLTAAHEALDRAVERCYRKEPFRMDKERVEHLFGLFEKLDAPILPAESKVKRRKSAPKSR